MERYSLFLDEKINIVKMPILLKAIYKQCNSYENIHVIFHKTRINKPKICKELQNSLNYQNNLIKKKKNNSQGIKFLDFRKYCKATVAKTWYWHKKEEFNGTKWRWIPEINTHMQ